MLNLNCVICAELFVASDDVRATNCGHMFHHTCLKQWMARSKSCPQCRNKCTDRNVFRIYFNLANLDTSTIDVGSLQEQVDNINLQLRVKEKELNKAELQIKELRNQQLMAAKTIEAMENRIQKNDFALLAYSEQLKILKTEAKMTDDYRKEVERLKQQIKTIESVQSILAATNVEAEKMLKIENDPVRLCTWVAALKRELRTCENKKTDLRRAMKVMQDNLRQEMSTKKSCEERILQLESENYQLQEKIKKHETKSFITERRRQSTESAPIALPEKRQTLSPTIKENIKIIEDSNSPYLNIKSSSIGLLPLFKRNHEIPQDRTGNTTTKLATLKISPNKTEKTISANGVSSSSGMLRKTQSDITEKYSIMKKPRLAMSTSSGPGKHFGINFELSSARTGSPTKPKPIGSTLDSRLKAGGLRNFKLNK